MGESKPLPPDYALLKHIGECIAAHFDSCDDGETAQITEVYGFIRLNDDLREQFPSAKDFSQFMRRMHHEQPDAMRRFICYEVDTSCHFSYKWIFYPRIKPMKRSEEDSSCLAKTGRCNGQLGMPGRIYPAANGVKVRSLQELHILNTLLEQPGLEIEYERALTVKGQRYFPDFTIRDTCSGKVFYWEHFGLSEKAAYAEEMAAKIAWYRQIRIAKIENGGRFIATIFVDEVHFVKLVDSMIGQMKKVAEPVTE